MNFIVDALSVSIAALCFIRFFGVILHIILFIRKRSAANLMLAVGWCIYMAGPAAVLSGYTSPEAPMSNFFPFSAAAGIMVIMLGLIQYIRRLSPKLMAVSFSTALLFLILMFLFVPGTEGMTATVVQGLFLLLMLFIAVFERKRIWKHSSRVSFFWLCFTLIIGLFHAFGFNLIFSSSNLALRFLLTGMLNMSLLLFVTFLDWEQTRAELEAAVKEKDILLQEVHHRVKNNLMIIASMLRLQTGSIEDRYTLELVNSIENRINSMALIHEQLYKNHNFTNIDFSDYIADLTEMIKSGFGYGSNEVQITVECERVDFDMNKLIPVGMLINEVVTNSFKHAFERIEEPEIYIGMRQTSDEQCVLLISDNGQGFDPVKTVEKNDTAGFIIIEALAEQIGAEISINYENGTEYMLVLNKKIKKS